MADELEATAAVEPAAATDQAAAAATTDDQPAETAAGGLVGAAPETNSAAPGSDETGIFPLFLTGQTLELFGLKALTAGGSEPHRAIPKVDLVSDMFARAAISDFAPAKKLIQDYKGDELVVVHDPDWKYGQNFYLLVTPEAAAAYVAAWTSRLRGGSGKKSTSASTRNVETSVDIPPAERARKPWVSMGSEDEVQWETVRPTRPGVAVRVSRRRGDFGMAHTFGDATNYYTVELRSASSGETSGSTAAPQAVQPAPAEVQRVLLTKGVQAVPVTVESAGQTTWNRPQHAVVQYEARQLDTAGLDAAINSIELEEFMRSAQPLLLQALQMNEVANVFADDYRELGDDDMVFDRGMHANLQECQSFTYIRRSKEKSASAVDWHPSIRGLLGVSCVQRTTFNERVDTTAVPPERQSCVLLWNLADPIRPQALLEVPDDVLCFRFNPEEPHLAAGGCLNGQVVLWDLSAVMDRLRRKNARNAGAASGTENGVGAASSSGEPEVVKYVAVSSIEHGHRLAVTDLAWLPKAIELRGATGEIISGSENGHMQLATSSLDGNVFFWDLRQKKELRALDLTWRPFLRAPVFYADNQSRFGLTRLALRLVPGSGTGAAAGAAAAPAAGSSRRPVTEPSVSTVFFVATEEGDLAVGDWAAGDGKAAATDGGDDKQLSCLVKALPAHCGPITDLQRSPFFPEIVLAVGGWTFSVWQENVYSGPLLTCVPAGATLTCAAWSLTRPGVFFVGRADGMLEVWDLMVRSHAPLSVYNVSSSAVSSIAMRTVTAYQRGALAAARAAGTAPATTSRQYLAVGNDAGTLHILDVPSSLLRPSKIEKKQVRAFIDRQIRHLAYVQERAAIRAREKAVFLESQLQGVAAGAAAGVAPSGAAPAAESGRPASSKALSVTGALASDPDGPRSTADKVVAEAALREAAAKEAEAREAEAQALEAQYRAFEARFLENSALALG